MRRLSANGDEFGAIDIKTLESITGYPSFSVFRSDLHRILLARLSELGTEVVYGETASSIETSLEGTLVHFASGLCIQPDVILGAEGRMQSVAREFVLGSNKPRYQGFVNWIGTYESEAPIFEDMSIQDIWGVGLRFGIVPVSPTRAYWAAAASQPNVRQSDRGSRQSELLRVFSQWPTLVRTILASPFAEECHEVHVYDHDPIEVWHRGNVVLIGDAAHAALPTSGQGACQALEDAWFFTNSLVEATAAASVPDIASRSTALRSAKTMQITLGGRSLAKRLFDTDAANCARRDQEARLADYGAMARGMAQFWWTGLPLAALPHG